ncbi:hypothetical protein ABBQ32_013393 [Trebouxia sp. C0010 RCD-2024]
MLLSSHQQMLSIITASPPLCCCPAVRPVFTGDSFLQTRRSPAKRRSTASAARNDQQIKEMYISESPPPPTPARHSQSLARNSIVVTIALGLVAFLAIRQATKKRPAARPAESPQMSQGHHQDSKDFKIAVARTRQAVSVQKAIGFMDASSPAKAIVELKHALEENGVARGPLLSTNTDKNDRLRLYRLHLQNTEMPPNFATLLQLREMLAIPEEDAEQLETDIFESGSAFSI